MNPELFLYGQIGGEDGITAAQFVGSMQSLPSDQVPIIRIHSEGGSVNEGAAIVNAIKTRPGGCVTQIDGLAASMASVIACAGNPVRMAANAMLAIHNVQGNATGDADAMRKDADDMDKFNETIVSGYSAKTGLSKTKIRAMMDATTYLTAKEAKELGFVDEITGDMALAARIGGKGMDQFRAALVDKKPHRMSDTVPAISAEDVSFLGSLRNLFNKPADPVAALRADVANRDLTITGLNAKLAELPTLKTTITDLQAKLKTAETELKAERDGFQAKLDKEVTARLAAAGMDPIKRDPAALNPTAMTRNDFQALLPAARVEFLKKGGTLTD